MANEKINEIKQGYIDEIEIIEMEISELKAIGKNYKLKKNGEPFADLKRTLNGVDGIARVEKVISRNLLNGQTNFEYWWIKLPSDLHFEIYIEHPSIADVEEKIAETIATCEKALAIDKKTLEALNGMTPECDNIVSQIAAMIPEDTEGEGVDSAKYELIGVMENYIKREIEDMFEKKRESYRQTERERQYTA